MLRETSTVWGGGGGGGSRVSAGPTQAISYQGQRIAGVSRAKFGGSKVKMQLNYYCGGRITYIFCLVLNSFLMLFDVRTRSIPRLLCTASPTYPWCTAFSFECSQNCALRWEWIGALLHASSVAAPPLPVLNRQTSAWFTQTSIRRL